MSAGAIPEDIVAASAVPQTRSMNAEATPFPLVEAVVPGCESHLLEQARRAARAFQEEEEPGDCGWRGEYPALIVADSSGVALSRPGATIEYRMLGLARPGDLMLVATPRAHRFESYYAERLGVRPERVISVPGEVKVALSDRCLQHPQLMRGLVDLAERAGGVNLVPYLGSRPVWRLARALEAQAGVKVTVAAAPAWLTARVNDKIWFSRLARAVLGEESVPPGCGVDDMAALCREVGERLHDERLVVKLPNSAASAGNLVLECSGLRELSPRALERELSRRLDRVGLEGLFPVQVSRWESQVQSSPSLQLWIPRQGLPVVEGIFDQAVDTVRGEFSGAQSADMSPVLAEELARQGVLLGTALQALGYYGRCSFDAILVGHEEPRLRWVECNGRWGGTSLPMTLATRLLGDWRARALVVVQLRTTCELTDPRDLGRHLFCRDAGRGVVWLAPGRVNFLVLGASLAEAREQARIVQSAFSPLDKAG